MLTQIAEAIAYGAVNKGIAIAIAFREQGLYLTGALFGLFLAQRGIKLAADSRDSLGEFFADFIEKLVIALIIFWVLEAVIYTQFMRDWLWEAFRSLAFRAAGYVSNVPGTGALGALEAALDQFQDGVIGALVKAQDSLSGGASPIGAALNYLKKHLWTLLVAGLVIVILGVAKALAVGAFCIGAVTFGVGAALGPLFIPLLLNDRLSNYFWSWFRFMIVSAATLLVAVVVVVLLAESLKPLAGPTGTVTNEWSFLLGSLSLNDLNFVIVATKAIVISIFLAFVLSQIPEITNALFSGSTAGIRSGAGPALRSLASGARQGGSLVGGAYRKLTDGGGGGKGGPKVPIPSPSGGLAATKTLQSRMNEQGAKQTLQRAYGETSGQVQARFDRATPKEREGLVSTAQQIEADRAGSIERIQRAAGVGRQAAAAIYDHATPSERETLMKEADAVPGPREAGGASGAARGGGSAFASGSGGSNPRAKTLERTPVGDADAQGSTQGKGHMGDGRNDAPFEQAAAARDRAQPTQEGWLERTPDGTPIAGSPEEVARAALAGDPEAQRIAQLSNVVAGAREKSERRRSEGSGRTLKRVEVPKGDEDKK